jgi:NADH:ubiquinone oxidoreductase subunit 5 (subunit L)/multisubunit Na+/H+ antiporter MnhA subunit
MNSPRDRANRGAMFLAIGAGAFCFVVSLLAMISFGIATGFEHVEISFNSLSQHHLDWWEIFSLISSLMLSALTSRVLFRYWKKFI